MTSKKMKKMKDNFKKKGEKKGRRLTKNEKCKTTSKKMEDQPINQNQPNWL